MKTMIALVLDCSFGDRIIELAKQMPVWIVSSPVNDLAAQSARSGFIDERITTLLARAQERPADLLARALYAIDEHYGEASQAAYDSLHVLGTNERPSDEIIRELGYHSIFDTPDGFTVVM